MGAGLAAGLAAGRARGEDAVLIRAVEAGLDRRMAGARCRYPH
jgi:hypothetical protein